LVGAVFKVAVMSVAIGAFLVSIMHYWGVPVPSADDLLGGLSRLARIAS
jgi:hypothetical protein